MIAPPQVWAAHSDVPPKNSVWNARQKSVTLWWRNDRTRPQPGDQDGISSDKSHWQQGPLIWGGEDGTLPLLFSFQLWRNPEIQLLIQWHRANSGECIYVCVYSICSTFLHLNILTHKNNRICSTFLYLNILTHKNNHCWLKKYSSREIRRIKDLVYT